MRRKGGRIGGVEHGEMSGFLRFFWRNITVNPSIKWEKSTQKSWPKKGDF